MVEISRRLLTYVSHCFVDIRHAILSFWDFNSSVESLSVGSQDWRWRNITSFNQQTFQYNSIGCQDWRYRNITSFSSAQWIASALPTNIPTQFYSANRRLARTQLYSISVIKSGWHFESNRSVRKWTHSLEWLNCSDQSANWRVKCLFIETTTFLETRLPIHQLKKTQMIRIANHVSFCWSINLSVILFLIYVISSSTVQM